MIEELMGVIPLSYDVAIFLDIDFIVRTPGLREVFERQLALIGPAVAPILDQADVVVVATGAVGVMGVLRGPLEPSELIGALGAPDSEVEAEDYGRFQILKMDAQFHLLRIPIGVTLVDETTAVFAASFPPQFSSVDTLKVVLDTLLGLEPPLLSDPVLGRLFVSTPRGFGVTVSRDCALFARLEACEGLALSSAAEGEYGVTSWTFEFSSSEMARAALPLIRERVERLGGPSSSPAAVEGSVEGNVVRVRAVVDIGAALEAAFGL